MTISKPILITTLLPLLVSALFPPALAVPPQISETAAPSTATNPTTIASYQSVFSSWRSSARHNPDIPPPGPAPPDARTKCNWQCSSPCPCALDPVPPEDVTTATWSGKSVYTTSTVSLLPSVTDALTATVGPLRTVIVRVSATGKAAPSGSGDSDAVAGGDSEQKQEQEKPLIQPAIADRNLNLDLNLDFDNNGTNATNTTDETNTFYTLPLSGYHPAVLPLITTAYLSNNPLTLLAYANTTLYSSFISSTLVSSLNLTSTISSPAPSSPFTPENDVTSLLGFNTKSLGVVNLDVLAGRNDRLVRGWPFVVFQAPTGGERDGLWTVDLWVGWSFLNEVQGVMLTGEYSGSREAGARDGMGVLVQRVFETSGGKDGSSGGDGGKAVGEL